MSILKKAGRCANCGCAIPAGSKVAWKQLTTNHRHGGNGTVTRVTSSWAPVHATLWQCELANVPGAKSEEEAFEILLAEAQHKIDVLKRQAKSWEGDEVMKACAEGQVRQAEAELSQLKARKGELS